MLAQILKDHTGDAAAERAATDRLHKDVLNSVRPTTDCISDSFNTRVQAVFQNQKEIEGLSKKYQASVSTFTAQTRAWLNLVDDFDNALKELGDIENWARVMERDFQIVTKTVEKRVNTASQTTTSAQPSPGRS